MIATEWGTGQVFWSLLWFVMFFIWLWLLVIVFSDIFRSHDLGGFAKTIWVLFVIIFPYLGVFVYLIARGHKMHEHAVAAAQAQNAAARASTSRTPRARRRSPAEELSRLADLKERGVISDDEFQKLKAKAARLIPARDQGLDDDDAGGQT